jgi:hypothetical protein
VVCEADRLNKKVAFSHVTPAEDRLINTRHHIVMDGPSYRSQLRA